MHPQRFEIYLIACLIEDAAAGKQRRLFWHVLVSVGAAKCRYSLTLGAFWCIISMHFNMLLNTFGNYHIDDMSMVYKIEA